jgi:hypothetical protein
METEGSLPRSLEPVTGRYPESHKKEASCVARSKRVFQFLLQ